MIEYLLSAKPGHTDPLSRLIAPAATALGDLGTRWQFPSDHLPVAARIDGLAIGSWNVLNSKWVHHIAKNTQGLAGSAIESENVPVTPGRTLTVRDAHVARLVLTLTDKLDLLLLQECGPPLFQRIFQALPQSFVIACGTSASAENDIAVIYNRHKLTLQADGSEFMAEGYKCKPGKAIMNLLFHDENGSPMRVVHTHVPGDPKTPGLAELAGYLQSIAEKGTITILAGDLNFSEEQIRDVFSSAGLGAFSNLVRINTNAADGKRAKRIDHILLFDEKRSAVPILSEELSPEIGAAAMLLNPIA